MWGFVGNKKNKQWIWIALDVDTRQVIAFHVGKRDRDAAWALWQKIPGQYQQQAGFYTDLYEPYVGVIPENQHHPVTKDSGLTVRSGRASPDWSGVPWLFPRHWLTISALSIICVPLQFN